MSSTQPHEEATDNTAQGPTQSPAQSDAKTQRPGFIQRNMGKLALGTLLLGAAATEVPDYMQGGEAAKAEAGFSESGKLLETFHHHSHELMKAGAESLSKLTPAQLLATARITTSHHIGNYGAHIEPLELSTGFMPGSDYTSLEQRAHPEQAGYDLSDRNGHVIEFTDYQSCIEEVQRTSNGTVIQLRHKNLGGKLDQDYFNTKKVYTNREGEITWDVNRSRQLLYDQPIDITFDASGNFTGAFSNGIRINNSREMHATAMSIYEKVSTLFPYENATPVQAVSELIDQGIHLSKGPTAPTGTIFDPSIRHSSDFELTGLNGWNIPLTNGGHLPQMFGDYIGEGQLFGTLNSAVAHDWHSISLTKGEKNVTRIPQNLFTGGQTVYVGFHDQKPFATYYIPKDGTLGSGFVHDLDILAGEKYALLKPYISASGSENGDQYNPSYILTGFVSNIEHK